MKLTVVLIHGIGNSRKNWADRSAKGGSAWHGDFCG